MADIPDMGEDQIPGDEQFENFREGCLNDSGWTESFSDDKTSVSSKKSDSSSIKIVRVRTTFDDLEACTTTIYDVLHDHDYRKTWDESMIEGYVIQMYRPDCEVGYYSAKIPMVSNRDFCNVRTWRYDQEREEYIIFNFSVKHDRCPERKDFVRARSILSGYFIKKLDKGCNFIYYSQSDPKGWIPSMFTNFIVTKFAPKLIQKLHDVSLRYLEWKKQHNPDKKTWLNMSENPETK